jgi:predicted transcriptional regulator of viral defense system
MKYAEFKEEFKEEFAKFPVFNSNIFVRLGVNERSLRNQLSIWLEKGLVIKLRKGLYTLNDKDREVKLTKNLISNLIYQPSYLSLESALSFYGFIPEQILISTAVSSKKTCHFENPYGVFSTHLLKARLLTAM